MRLLLDTNVYSRLRRGHVEAAAWVERASRLYLSTVVAGELLAGFLRGTKFEENVSTLKRFLGQPYVRLLPVRYSTADRYGRAYADLRARGRPIPTNDLWIAAQALETGALLVSFDAHFEAIPGLAFQRLTD